MKLQRLHHRVKYNYVSFEPCDEINWNSGLAGVLILQDIVRVNKLRLQLDPQSTTAWPNPASDLLCDPFPRRTLGLMTNGDHGLYNIGSG
ncbi:hypothetical protein RRG08_015722 [Elysia crispata]|uniref:Uncharacterized protein n=1 Tax=Elysia crispata TaxID=231223 RepID=A0AAE0Z656_9GAST|nr:hypothetical protein RRG08_015722 [Elysia crispata]